MEPLPLVPFYELRHVCTDSVLLHATIGLEERRGTIKMGKIKGRVEDVRALEAASVQQLINNGTITLRPPEDDSAWYFVGGYSAFMEKYGLKPKL